MKILDCTLRDGGYYTNWDFDKHIVKSYCETMESLPIDYVEVGYRSIPLEGYYGKFFYCPDYILKELRSMMPSKKIAIILNEKDVRQNHLNELLSPCKDYVSLVRIAVNPVNFKRALDLAKSIKSMGFEVAFNVMYMSEWKKDSSFLDLLNGFENIIDYFYMVDSFGGVFQNDIIKTIELIKSKVNIKIGFHGHNNLEMALANTITAIDEGCCIVDSTVTGMGRGAGNLKTELFMTYLSANGNKDICFKNLSSTVSIFENLRSEHKWGTNMPYMFSGAFSLPQKQVMEWIGMNRYPISSIVNALQNKKSLIDDNLTLKSYNNEKQFSDVIIIGGGNSVINNIDALKYFLEKNKDVAVIHTGLKYILDFKDICNYQFYSLVGTEGDMVKSYIKGLDLKNKKFIYPPHPRKMGTLIPKEIISNCFELTKIDFSNQSNDSPLATAIQLSFDFKSKNYMLIGFDGYDVNINKSQFRLMQENQSLINDLLNFKNISVKSLTVSRYDNLKYSSIYSLIR